MIVRLGEACRYCVYRWLDIEPLGPLRFNLNVLMPPSESKKPPGSGINTKFLVSVEVAAHRLFGPPMYINEKVLKVSYTHVGIQE